MAVGSLASPTAQPVIAVKDLVKRFPLHRGLVGGLSGKAAAVHAVNGVTFSVKRGESLGLAGESGCGKSTTAKLLVRLYQPSSGNIEFNGEDIGALKGEPLKEFRRRGQMMFQNPYESFSPRFTILRAIAEPLIIHGLKDANQRKELVRQALETVRLSPPESFFSKYPHQLSGGQLQRVALARALVLEPDFLVADEPVSMLDVSVRAGILNTMREQAKERELTTVYISHDLSLLQYLCDTTAIMYLGQIVEIGPTHDVIDDPKHPYTQALVAAIPIPEPERQKRTIPIEGSIPSSIALPSGCPFHPRCPHAMEICREQLPPPVDLGPRRSVRCFLFGGASGQNAGSQALPEQAAN